MYHIRRGIGRFEVFVVVFIVAILLGVLLPALAKGRSESASDVCESKLRRQWMGHLMWAEDNDGHFYDDWLWYRYMMTSANKKGYMTYDDIDCPASRKFGVRTARSPYGYWSSSGPVDPPIVEGGYAFNRFMNSLSMSSPGPANKLANHKYLAKTAMVVDSWNPYWTSFGGWDFRDSVSYRHKEKNFANIVWLDGHVSAVDPEREINGDTLYYDWPNSW